MIYVPIRSQAKRFLVSGITTFFPGTRSSKNFWSCKWFCAGRKRERVPCKTNKRIKKYCLVGLPRNDPPVKYSGHYRRAKIQWRTSNQWSQKPGTDGRTGNVTNLHLPLPVESYYYYWVCTGIHITHTHTPAQVSHYAWWLTCLWIIYEWIYICNVRVCQRWLTHSSVHLEYEVCRCRIVDFPEKKKNYVFTNPDTRTVINCMCQYIRVLVSYVSECICSGLQLTL